jgi:hypothetical protein
MSNQRSPRRLHPALATLIAFGVHAALLVAVRLQAPQPPVSVLRTVDAEIELLLETQEEGTADGRRELAAAPVTDLSHGADATTASRTAVPAKAPRADARIARADVATLGVAPGASDVSSAPGAEPASEAGAPSAAQPIDLGLNGGVRRTALLEGWSEPSAVEPKPSDGGLRAGLAALDAQRGLSRSSATNPAGYEAARRFAPPNGIGIFDILTDERGLVLSVTLASAPADEARWQRVGEELHALLEDRRFRVPLGAKGLAARVRIETGELAKDIADRFRTLRGPALGQDTSQAREAHNESTRAQLEPGQLSPSLGVKLAGGGSPQHIRVVLLSERPL